MSNSFKYAGELRITCHEIEMYVLTFLKRQIWSADFVFGIMGSVLDHMYRAFRSGMLILDLVP